MGTPAYMAPEQLEGKKPGPATDVYALGLILYEMLTGTRAFVGDTAFQIAVARLQGPPTRPSVHAPGLDPVWEGTILRCLEKEPSDRFQDVSEVSRVLHSGGVVGGVPSHRRLRRRRGLVWGGAVVAGAMVALAAWLVLSGGWTVIVRGGGGTRPSVAVLGFANVSGAEVNEWIGTALGEILVTELAADGALRTIPAENVVQARTDLGLDTIQTLGDETLEQLRRHLGSDLVVLGSYTIPPGATDLRLDLRVQRAADGEQVASASESGPVAELMPMAAAVATELRRSLGVGEIAAGAGVVAEASLPSDPEAAKLFAEGVALLRDFDPEGAAAKLEAAVAADPDAPMAWSALASARGTMGLAEQARVAAERA